jgi:hypothetical protein
MFASGRVEGGLAVKRPIVLLCTALGRSVLSLAVVMVVGGLFLCPPRAGADEITDDFEVPVESAPAPVEEPTPYTAAPEQPAPRRAVSRRDCGPVDRYDDSQSHPLRVVAYFVHPVGYALEWMIFRPLHWVVAQPNLEAIFGHEYHEGYVVEDDSLHYR